MTKRTTSPAADTAGTFTPPGAGGGGAPAGATAEGTARYARRHADAFAADHYRRGPLDLTLSSLGIGTYLGSDADADDDAYQDTIRAALRGGLNVLDTAINYRCQRSERAAGRALQQLLADGDISRDEIVVCTKAGYVPLEGHAPSTPEGYQGYLRREFYARRVMAPDDVVAGGHCLAPGFLADCLQRSMRNLDVSRIDVFYIHNPEQQLGSITPEELHARLRTTFELLEAHAAAGQIGVYGVSTWQGLRVAPGARAHLALRDLDAIARDVAGDAHHFRVVQLPMSLAMPEAFRVPTQPLRNGDLVPATEAATALGLTLVTSAPLMQGQLTRDLPPALHDLFPALQSDAQRAIAFARSIPGATTALVGMKRRNHLEENLAAAR